MDAMHLLQRNYFVLFTVWNKSACASWVSTGVHLCGNSLEMCFSCKYHVYKGTVLLCLMLFAS